MKRRVNYTLFILMFTAASSLNLYSQSNLPEQRNDIKVQISDGIPLAVVSLTADIFESIFGNLLTFGNYKKESTTTSSMPHIGAGYKYRFNNRFSAGLNVSYQSISKDFELKNRNNNNYAEGHESMSALLIMPSIEYFYTRGTWVQLYGNADLGVGILSLGQEVIGSGEGKDTTSGAFFGFQINPLGVRVGKQVAGFLELGAGMKGIFTLGLNARF